MTAQCCRLVDYDYVLIKVFVSFFKKSCIYLYMMQLVVSSREMVQLPQHSQVPDVVDVIVTDVQHTKRILNKDSDIRF